MEHKEIKAPSFFNCTKMRRASRVITQFYDSFLAPSGLRFTKYSLLSHLNRIGPLSMMELSKAIRLERTTLVRNLKLLEKMRLVSITAEENSRANKVHITENGLKSLELAIPYWSQAQKYIKGLFTEEEFRIFLGALENIESIVI